MGLFTGIKQNVIILGIVSFLTDVSSEMIFPILPVFLTTILGIGKEAIGFIEGVADSASSLLDILVGYWSDKGHRKKFVIAGYGLSSFSKLGIALASTWPFFLVFRGVERIGKSIRTSPRDAIIAASSGKETRGKAFGLHRAMDTLGAVLGPAIAYVILAWLGSTESGYHAVFYAALIPAFLAVAVIWFFVREPKAKQLPPALTAKEKVKQIGFWQKLKLLTGDYKRFLLVSCLFSLAYFSYALLIVRASEIGISAENILLIYILYNIVYMVFSVPIGQLSDRIGRKPIIVTSFFLYALIVAGFIFASNFWQVAALFAIYGIFVTTDESVNKAYISDMVKEKERGIALGAYNTAVGAVYLPASAIFGALWAGFGAPVAFGAAALVAAISGVAMLVYAK
ncbi:Multidrug resistance protein MdtG [uncultured archaeon]|nr:Multidrug resistance protein MdtG [uncultured archaeon]